MEVIKTVEVIKEVPIEIIKEVIKVEYVDRPVEVIKYIDVQSNITKEDISV